MTTLYLTATPAGIEIAGEIEESGRILRVPFTELVRPGESFGGYSYEELLVIATTRGQMDADELRV